MSAPGMYSGQIILAEVTHVTRGYGLPSGLVVMSIRLDASSTNAVDISNPAALGKHHHLKTDPVPFRCVLNGSKRHEVRKDDRGFEVGDYLVLHELTEPCTARVGEK